jgi:branched-chain amino acid:cation transporter, LIVCS family
MQSKLKIKEYVYIASMLFGLFFGAGNLIFPVSMGQMAGSNVWPAIIGFLITGVGLPLLGIMAMGISRSNGLYDLASRVHPYYSLFFTCALYLTIGPFFAIPRTATVSFEVGIVPFVNKNQITLWLGIFSLIFFLAVLWFSLRPSNILTWVGKILNPLFLLFLAILIITAFLNPMGNVVQVPVQQSYQNGSFFKGFLEGYNTMDALASLAFGIVVINVIRNLGVEDSNTIAFSTMKSGIFSMSLMALIYVSLTIMGTQSRGIFPVSKNGGEALSLISNHYFGKIGAVLLAIIITLACLKTAVGLITSCSQTFVNIFPNSVNYKIYAIGFSVVSFVIANFGLNNVIAFSIPVLMFLYPLAITLILLTLFQATFNSDHRVYQWVTGFTAFAAIFDFVGALPDAAINFLHLDGMIDLASNNLPFYNMGMGWIVPALVGLVIGLFVHFFMQKNQ